MEVTILKCQTKKEKLRINSYKMLYKVMRFVKQYVALVMISIFLILTIFLKTLKRPIKISLKNALIRTLQTNNHFKNGKINYLFSQKNHNSSKNKQNQDDIQKQVQRFRCIMIIKKSKSHIRLEINQQRYLQEESLSNRSKKSKHFLRVKKEKLNMFQMTQHSKTSKKQCNFLVIQFKIQNLKNKGIFNLIEMHIKKVESRTNQEINIMLLLRIMNKRTVNLQYKFL